MREKILLIDGNSIVNRAFYGIPDLTNSEGLHTNAIYGFLSILFKFLEEENPEYLLVAFDVHAKTFRHDLFQEYKGTRKGMPEELREQIPILKDVLRSMNIHMVEQAGLEADDILGTWAKRCEVNGMDVSLVSGDRDLLQIASDHIKIRIPKTKKGVTEVEDYFAKDLKEVLGITPEQVIELKALMGDTADNIPGVPKVGKVTAQKLIEQYGTMENVYQNIDEISAKALKKNLEENYELAKLSKKLATIEINAPIEHDIESAKHVDVFTTEAYGWYKKLGFHKFLSKFEQECKEEQLETIHVAVISELGDFDKFLKKLMQCASFAVFSETLENKLLEMYGIAISIGENDNYYIEFSGFLSQKYVFQALNDVISQVNKRSVICYSVKNLYPLLGSTDDVPFFDMKIAAYLLNPLMSQYQPENISNEYLGRSLPGREEVLGKNDKEADAVKQRTYCVNAVDAIYRSYRIIKDKLTDEQMYELFDEIEMPTTYVLYTMEQVGIGIKRDELHMYSIALDERIHELEELIYQDAGKKFNINSPKQLGEILYEDLEIPGGKKTKTGYSTAADVLDRLAPSYPIVQNVLEYRGLAKLKSTYAEGLSGYIGEDERIHSTFHQTVAATGRLSSTDPNLQNIPIRMELGRKIRKVFVPKPGYVFVDADYSQIELRILAHMSGDEKLIAAYNENSDIHTMTASQVFHIPPEEVTPLERRNAKAVNFGIVYGISSFGLSQDLSISRKEAAGYIEDYFKTYPKVKSFLDELVESAKESGYSTTVFHRKRPIPELKDSNFMRRSFGERVAMNAPIQGTAADVIKIAAIHVYQELKRRNLQSKLILQIHDELLIEAKEDEVDEVRLLLEEQMKHAVRFLVELEVDVHTGDNWYDTK